MTRSYTVLASNLLKSKGFDAKWLTSESPLTSQLQQWIINTLTKEKDMTISNNPYLLILVVKCCANQYSLRNAEKLITSPDFEAAVKTVVNKHFSGMRSCYEGNTIANTDELLEAAPSILFLALNKRQGFDDKWMTYEASQTMGNFFLWIRHRLSDSLKSTREKHIVSAKPEKKNEDGTSKNPSNDDPNDDNSLGGIDDIMILEEAKSFKQLVKDLVLNIPIITIKQAASLIKDSDYSWKLFVRLNDLNLLQWLMSNPSLCHNVEIFDLLADYADISLNARISWKNNLSTLIEELESSETSRGTKAKDHTLLAFFDNIETIEELRNLSDIKKHRETLRRRNNNTNAGLYALCLLACLTIKGTNDIGVKLLTSLLNEYNKEALKLVPEGEWKLSEELLTSWAQTSASIKDLNKNLLNIIALVRYQNSYDGLSKKKQENVLQIHRIVKSIGIEITKGEFIPLMPR